MKDYTPPKRVEVFRPISRQRISIVDLIGLVTACAVFFGGVRVAGAYGVVFGGFALQAALGRLSQRNDWQLGSFAGALTCIGMLTCTWFFHGTSQQLGQPPFAAERISVASYFEQMPGPGPFVLPLLMCFALSFVVAFILPRASGQTRTDLIAVSILSLAAIAVSTFIAIGCVNASL